MNKLKTLNEIIVGSSELGDYNEAVSIPLELLKEEYPHIYRVKTSDYFNCTYSGEKVKDMLREEAKKWIMANKDAYLDYLANSKEYDGYSVAYCEGAMDMLKQFFNITEEDLE